LRPTLRGAAAGLPFRFDQATVRAGLNFTLDTVAGPLDLFGDVAGGGDYRAPYAGSVDVEMFGVTVRCSLDQLIATKRAAGRPRDMDALAELEILREERHGNE
jgi:hypothetical protein